jgi:hypothetical protein
MKKKAKEKEHTSDIINTGHKHDFHIWNVNQTGYRKRPYYRGTSYSIIL